MLAREEYAEYIKNHTLELFSDVPYTELYFSNRESVMKKYAPVSAFEREAVKRDVEALLFFSSADISLPSRFAFPNLLLVENGEIVGFEMPLVVGNKLADVISDAPPALAVKWFTQIYDDICYLQSLNLGIALSDLHEDNVIVDPCGEIHHIDVDGWYIGDGKGKHARYLSLSRDLLLHAGGKYTLEEDGDLILANRDTDMFCLLNIILNYIMQGTMPFSALSPCERWDYLKFLQEELFPNDFVTAIQSFCSETPTRFERDTILSLPSDLSRFSYEKFRAKRNRFKSEAEALSFLENKRRQLDIWMEQRRGLML